MAECGGGGVAEVFAIKYEWGWR
uniref:Uncharacterized protein n=1 Tax=Anguilla anguilla TaxID=7936 RepID=A0A0E9R8E8_ANGAN